MKFKQSHKILTATIAIALVLTGCAKSPATTEVTTENTSPIETTESAANASETTYPIIIKHAFGETIIESKPERVATISWGNQDLPLALGVVPVGISKANYGVIDDSGLLPWTAAKFEALDVTDPVLFDDIAGLNFEAIADVKPDVILAAYSGITQEEYDLLSEIAPVVA